MIDLSHFCKVRQNTFESVLEQCRKRIKKCSDVKQGKLKDELNHGMSQIDSAEVMDMYIAEYGEIHRDKLLRAYGRMPKWIWNQGRVSIIDYGCGQGLAEMILSDYMYDNLIEQDLIDAITLIEPSGSCLKQANCYVREFFPNVQPTLVEKPVEYLDFFDVHKSKGIILHILSNVVDMKEFNYHNVANVINQLNDCVNLVVCVSPFYHDSDRGKRMREFGKCLQGFHRLTKIEHHTDDWSQCYSCQIHIYTNYVYG